MPTERLPGVEHVIDLIEECELAYREPLETAIRNGLIRDQEDGFLQAIDEHLPTLVFAFDSSVPPPRARGGRPALDDVSRAWQDTSGDADARRVALIRSLIALETERQGQFRLNRSQNARIAANYDAIAGEFVRVGLPAHAAMAFQRAADFYLLLQDSTKRDRALLNMHRARHRTRRPGPTRALEVLSDATCGYGYRPYLLLMWMFWTLVLFSALVWWSSSDNLAAAARVCAMDFLNPLGLDQLWPSSGVTQTLLVVESYVGTVSMSMFFALLVRRWFQA